MLARRQCQGQDPGKFLPYQAPAKPPLGKFVKVNFDPRIPVLAIHDGLKKTDSAVDHRKIRLPELGFAFPEQYFGDFSFGIPEGQTKFPFRSRNNFDRCLRQQDEGMITVLISIMDTNPMNEKRLVFGVIAQRNEKYGDSAVRARLGAGLDPERESCLGDVKARPDKVFDPRDGGKWGRH